MQRFRNFLAVLPPPTLYKVETRKKFWIHASSIVLWGEAGERLDLKLVNWKMPQKCKSVPRLLFMIVVHLIGCLLLNILLHRLWRLGTETLKLESKYKHNPRNKILVRKFAC